MKYSENPHYLEYISRKARGDIEGAKQALLRCLSDIGAEGDRVQRSDLLQRIGTLAFEQGNPAKALDYYEQSEASDPDSLLAQHYYAKFLAEKLKNYDRAIAKCDAIIAKSMSMGSRQSDDDFSSSDYSRMAMALKQFCVAEKSKKK